MRRRLGAVMSYCDLCPALVWTKLVVVPPILVPCLSTKNWSIARSLNTPARQTQCPFAKYGLIGSRGVLRGVGGL
ncbi:hypothetical protein BDW72DRAFT_168593 [Aspergillus terricola var. indicus]